MTDESVRLFFARLAAVAAAHGLGLYACASPLLADLPVLSPGRCIDGALLEALFGGRVSRAGDGGQRAACGCTKSADIGSYDRQCGFGCVYCYGRR